MKIWDQLKRIWILLWASVFTLILFLPITLSALLSRTGNMAFTLSRLWAWLMLRITFVRSTITGRENIVRGQTYIIISNHQSNYDILAVVTKLGLQFRWVIKKELLKVPLFGYALKASRNIFIDRSDRDKARESIAHGLERVPSGASVIFFAEGTRSRDGKLQPFKKGAFHLAMDTGSPILPVTINGSRHILPKGNLAFCSGTIDVFVGKPIPTDGYSPKDLDVLVEKTRKAISAHLKP